MLISPLMSAVFVIIVKHSIAKHYQIGLIGESFNVYLSVVGILIICVLMFDIHKYLNSMRRYFEHNQNGKFKLIEGEDGELIISVPMIEEQLELPDYYLFTTGRHSGSFFLRIGAAIFCVGHIIHMLVIMVRQIQYYFLEEGRTELECTSPVHISSCLLKSTYDFLQLYMIFKYSNVIVNRSKRLARFCFIHCLSASLCLWIHAIMQETVEYVLDEYVATNYTSVINSTCADFANSCLDDRGHFELDIGCLIEKTCVCTAQDQAFDAMFAISAYSFPFTIEFGILTAGVWYVMWSNIGKVAEHKQGASYMPSLEAEEPNKLVQDGLYIFADCSKAIKGIFAGIIFCAVGVIGLIVYEVFYIYPGTLIWYPSTINDVFEGTMLLAMIFATVYVSQFVSQFQCSFTQL